jgi:hypothetical protein
MRKLITSSVLFMLFSMLSGTVFAGKIAVCENIKHDPAYKGLYGLCNAYWNADEDAQPVILEQFRRKAGENGPGMPGLEPGGEEIPDPVCPCWPDSQIDIGVTPDYWSCQVTDTYAWASYDSGLVQYTLGGDGVNSCSYLNYLTSELIIYPDLNNPVPTDEEMALCAAQLLERIANDFEGMCL